MLQRVVSADLARGGVASLFVLRIVVRAERQVSLIRILLIIIVIIVLLTLLISSVFTRTRHGIESVISAAVTGARQACGGARYVDTER